MKSPNFDELKYFYESGFWNEKMLMDAVEKGLITGTEYDEIVAAKN